MIENQNGKVLVHYGVKGMEWGKHIKSNNIVTSSTGKVHTIYGPGINTNKTTIHTTYGPQTKTVTVSKRPSSINQKVASSTNNTSSGNNTSNKSSTTTKSSNTSGLMTLNDVKETMKRNNAAATSRGTDKEDEKEEKSTKSTKSKKSESTKEKNTKETESSKNKSLKITSKTTDEEIMRNALGDNYDTVRDKMLKKMAEKGSINLTKEEMAECIGKDFDKISKQILDDKAKRDKALNGENSITSKDSKSTEESLDSKAYAVIRGDYGNGSSRKDALGSEYSEVQKRVNEIMKNKKKKESITAKEVKHSEDYLEHHGILGQKWGVRRYQNPDGTLTSAGKARLSKNENKRNSDEKKSGNHTFNKEKATKLAIAAATGMTLAAGALYVAKHPEAAESIGKVIGKTAYKASKLPSEAAKYTVNVAKKSGKRFVDSSFDTATTLALASAAGYAVKKVDEKYANSPEVNSALGKQIKEISRKSINSGINSALYQVNTTNKGGNQNGGNNIGRETSVKLGPPKSHGPSVDTTSTRWNDLFKEPNLTKDARSTIKALRQNGYDIDQIEAYVYGGMWK